MLQHAVLILSILASSSAFIAPTRPTFLNQIKTIKLLSTPDTEFNPCADDSFVADDYVAIGLACCFRMCPEEGKLKEAWIYEPLTAGSLECIEKGIETSYRQVLALRAADFFEGPVTCPTGVNMENIEALGDGYEVKPCDNIVERTMAAARTYRRREEAKMIDFNEMSDEYNFSVERKRILDQVKVVNFEDNVKQDKSIDVYGRDDDGKEGDTVGTLLNDEIDKLANA